MAKIIRAYHSLIRNLSDYGYRTTIRKVFTSILAPFYLARTYRTYCIDLDKDQLISLSEVRSKFEFKLIKAGDVSIIEQIESIAEWLTGKIEGKLSDSQICMVAMDKDKLAGFNIVALNNTYIPLLEMDWSLGKNEAWSEQITVNKAYRRQGLGNQLRQRMFYELRTKGITKFCGGALAGNVASLKLAWRAGFTEVEDIKLQKILGRKKWQHKEVHNDWDSMVIKKHALFIVENNSVPGDVRVWPEALAVRDLGFRVSVICPKNRASSKSFEIIDNIRIFRHPVILEAKNKNMFFIEYVTALIWEWLLALAIFIKNPFHIIHAANPPDHIFIIALFFKLFGVRFIFDHHDICPEKYLAMFEKKDFFYFALLLFEKFTFKTADVVISTNESYKRIALDRGEKNADEVFVVRNGPDLEKIKPVPSNPELKRGFDYLVAYVGVIGIEEGIDNLLRAIEHIVNRRGIKNIKFVIMGNGPNWREMVSLSQEIGLSKYVQFTGHVTYDTVSEILSTADIGVNPEFKNNYTDKSTMLKIMDYMAFETAIVQSDVTEGRVTAGPASVYIQKNCASVLGETIIDLLNSPDKRNRMGKFGRKRIIEELIWDKQKVNLQMAYAYMLRRTF